MDGALFRAVDVGDLEAKVLRDAEKRARDATIPRFASAKGLGFGNSTLGNFCSTADSLVLRMAADEVRREGRALRESGVANLTARDRVQMKQQILMGLLQVRCGEGGDANDGLGATKLVEGVAKAHASETISNGSTHLRNDDWNRREDLVRTGAVTPLDELAGISEAVVPKRARMTLMDHKIAEGMNVELPRSRRRSRQARSFGSGQVETRPGSDKKQHATEAVVEVFSSGEDNPAGDDAATPQQLVDDDSWACERCTLVCPADAGECLACGERRSRKRNTPRASGSYESGAIEGTSRLGSSGIETGIPNENTVECPVCRERVRVDDPTNPDVLLSKHMDRCTRRTRRSSLEQSEDEDEHEDGDKARSKRIPTRRRGANGSTSDKQLTQRKSGRQAAVGKARGSTVESGDGAAAKKRKEGKPKTKRSKSGRALVSGEEDVIDTSTVLRKLAGGQPLVDDFNEEDFEERKAQVDDVQLANGAGDNDFSASSPFDLGEGLTMDGSIAHRLFQFQLTGVRWMWQLHKQGAGGIVGDEMGLGKTVQVAAFLGALHDSNVMRQALILCPATVLSHWMAELHTWAPQLRVVVLHRCVQAFNAASGSSGKLRTLIRRILSWPDVVVVTSYEGMKALNALLLPCNWDYCILDEGQRIRNPDAKVTLICKQIRTVHRLVLTGTPIQNNLRELWSLFDFVFPGRLGTLPAFEAEFANPIRVGGYANASPMQARLAYRCALVLRDLIHPYLLRRQKKDLKDIIRLTAKTEQVLFCRLTSYQRQLYGEFLASSEVKSVLSRTMRAFRAIGILRKLCNHPDLVCRVGDSVVSRLAPQKIWGKGSETDESDGGDVTEGASREEHGVVQRSGKLLVLKQLLPLWHTQGHRVLLFSQTRQMLNIIERFVNDMGWNHARLDGSTPVGIRQALIDRFNNDESIFIMLLTTRTGGVGVNLTGADRVILFDPDWNPSTDMQARERAWRVGQRRQVTVYRLITAGTIEEKIYHRQIFKTALTNRILQDAKQRRIFSADELGDLFSLGDDGSLDGFTDTVDLFQGEGKVNVPDERQKGSKKRSPQKSPEGAVDTGRRRKGVRKDSGKSRRDSGKSRRDQSIPRGEEQASNSSSLIGTTTVTIDADHGGDASKDGDNDKSNTDDMAVLQALYDGAPLSSVFHHDLAEGSELMTVEHKRMEEAAKRAAQKAVNQLRMSRRTLRAGAGQGGFQSSWTGRNGGASGDALSPSAQGGGDRIPRAPAQGGRRFGTVSNPSIANGIAASTGGTAVVPRQREALSTESTGLGSEQGSSSGIASQDILRQIRLRNGAQPAQSPGLFPEFQAPGTSDDKDAFYSSLLQRLQDYLAQAPAGVDTSALIHAFGDVSPADVPVFRRLLQAVAVCTNGEWTLKDVPST